MSNYLAEAHADWHAANPQGGVCPLDCAMSQPPEPDWCGVDLADGSVCYGICDETTGRCGDRTEANEAEHAAHDARMAALAAEHAAQAAERAAREAEQDPWF